MLERLNAEIEMYRQQAGGIQSPQPDEEKPPIELPETASRNEGFGE